MQRGVLGAALLWGHAKGSPARTRPPPPARPVGRGWPSPSTAPEGASKALVTVLPLATHTFTIARASLAAMIRSGGLATSRDQARVTDSASTTTFQSLTGKPCTLPQGCMLRLGAHQAARHRNRPRCLAGQRGSADGSSVLSVAPDRPVARSSGKHALSIPVRQSDTGLRSGDRRSRHFRTDKEAKKWPRSKISTSYQTPILSMQVIENEQDTGGRTRTDKAFRPQDFESSASTNFTTPAFVNLRTAGVIV
jgi:hypothetical protein